MISTSSSIDKANIAKLKVFEESVQNNLAANMVSAWDADHVTKGTTWVLNDKWGGNNGIFYNDISTACSTTTCPQIVSDNQIGNVLSFDGVNDYIDLGNNNDLNMSSEITVSVWIKNKNSGAEKIVLGKGWYNDPNGRSWWILKDWDNKLKFGIITDNHEAIYNNVINTTGATWYHVVGTYDNSKIKIYVNGDKGTDYDKTGSFISNSSVKIGIGHYNGYISYGFDGLINDIKIYNAALSSAQIKQNYIAGLNSLLNNGNMSKEEYYEKINALAYE